MRNINSSTLLLHLFLCISLLVGFNFNEDSGGGGSVIDFHSTWPLILDPFSPNLTNYDFKFPLHYIIGSAIFNIIGNQEFYRLFFVLVAFFLPNLFFKCLKVKFYNFDHNILYLLSLILLILPSVRTSAIWANTQFSGIIFFLLSIYYFLKWEKEGLKKITFNLIFNLIFISLAVYTRQIYALVYLYFLFVYFRNLKINLFFYVSIITFCFSLPGLYYVYFFPKILQVTFDSSLQDSILVNLSMISFYFVPFVLVLIFQKKIKLQRNFLIVLFFSFIFIFFLSQFFTYNYKNGGGVLMKFSLIIFNDFTFFFLTSLFGLICIYIICENKIENYFLTLSIILGISAYIISQKYFEPMMIILLFLIYKNSYTGYFLRKTKNTFFFILYFTGYYISVLIADYFNIKKFLIFF